jgi:mevalonate kinase
MGELVTSINQLREAIAKYTTAERTDNDEATQKFYETLSDSSTNSIAKIRAAAQQYLDDTAGVADKEG